MSETILKIEDLQVRYGGIEAVKGISFDVQQGQIVTLIGSNGAGKSSTLRTISGLVKPSGGKITFQGEDITGKDPTQIVTQGVTLVPEGRRIFPDMTVLENVMVGRHCRTRAGIWGALSRDGHTRREEQESIDISYALLESLHLQELWNEKARNLAYGAQRRLEIARALATEPRMLLLDEPAAGMNPQETHELEILVRGIRDARNLSILLIEHDMSMVMSLSDRIYVMEYGSCIAMGKPEEVRANPRVIKAYLGESDA